jgi:hypothetical protein
MVKHTQAAQDGIAGLFVRRQGREAAVRGLVAGIDRDRQR